MKELHVVFGARGALGSAIVRHLAERGKPVRAVVREDEKIRCRAPAHAELFFCDPIHRRRAIEAASGATVVYRCLNVNLSQWAELWVPITENIIAAAQAAGARLVSPGNMFVYGPLQQLPANEDHPLAPIGEKGRVRIATQTMLFKAHESGNVEVVIPRFPDVFGPCVTTRFHGGLFASACRGEAVRWLGKFDIPRAVIYINDAARACVTLGAEPESYGRAWHVVAPETPTPRQLIQMAFSAAGHRPHVRRLSDLQLWLEALFDPEVRAFREFHYLFEQPQVFDGSRFASAHPDFCFTPLEEAVKETLEWFRRHCVS